MKTNAQKRRRSAFSSFSGKIKRVKEPAAGTSLSEGASFIRGVISPSSPDLAYSGAGENLRRRSRLAGAGRIKNAAGKKPFVSEAVVHRNDTPKPLTYAVRNTVFLPAVEKSLFDMAVRMRKIVNDLSPDSRSEVPGAQMSIAHSVTQKYGNLFPDVVKTGCDRRGYYLAEVLAERASGLPENSRQREETIRDMKDVLSGGGLYSSRNRLFEDLLEKGDFDVLKAFDDTAVKFGTLTAADGRKLAPAIREAMAEREAQEKDELKQGIIEKYFDGDLKGAENDLAKLSKEDRTETRQAASVVLWSAGIEHGNPDTLRLAASLTETMNKTERTTVADMLTDWFEALDGDKRRLAGEWKMQESLGLAGLGNTARESGKSGPAETSFGMMAM